jgi:D-inositol-3-phosphate glycosyltransferase
VSLLEAMSSGLCPVVTEVGGNAAVLGPELAHRLVSPEDPEALAAAWQAALGDPAARRSDGTTARARVERHFSLAAMVRSYESLYRNERTGLSW